jgi:hypothetical protein
VATGSGDQLAAAAGRGRLRASNDDREQVIDTLKAAFVQGRLTKDELDTRVGQTLASRTYADLAALTADIPAGLTGTKPLRKPAPARPRRRVSTAAKAGVGVIIAVIMLLVTAIAADSGVSIADALFPVAVITFVASFIAWGWTLSVRAESRSRGQLPREPAPGAGGRPSQRAAAAAAAEQFRHSNQGQENTSEAVRSWLPAPQLPGLRSPHRWRPGGLDLLSQPGHLGLTR